MSGTYNTKLCAFEKRSLSYACIGKKNLFQFIPVNIPMVAFLGTRYTIVCLDIITDLA